MKSIVEEAPSILKAIEKAWSRAGNPAEFSVKIFEDAQKNFFGMTTKHAKVGVFFEIEPLPTSLTEQRRTGPTSLTEQRRTSPSLHSEPSPSSSLRRTGLQAGKPAPQRPSGHSHEPRQGQRDEGKHRKPATYRELSPRDTQNEVMDDALPFMQSNQENGESTELGHSGKKRMSWNDEMLTAVSMWLKDLLAKSNMGEHQPTLTVLDSRLIILFEKPLFDDPAKASDLYRSLSYLLIGMVRSRFKKEFRFLKIVLTDGSRDRDTNES